MASFVALARGPASGNHATLHRVLRAAEMPSGGRSLGGLLPKTVSFCCILSRLLAESDGCSRQLDTLARRNWAGKLQNVTEMRQVGRGAESAASVGVDWRWRFVTEGRVARVCADINRGGQVGRCLPGVDWGANWREEGELWEKVVRLSGKG